MVDPRPTSRADHQDRVSDIARLPWPQSDGPPVRPRALRPASDRRLSGAVRRFDAGDGSQGVEFSLCEGAAPLAEWSWADLEALPQAEVKVDIHCATTWSKLDTKWQGVMIDTLLEAAGLSAPPTCFAMVHSERDYTTNVPVEDLVDGKAMVATQPLASEHGGPARLLVPHLYFWKSAKWARRLQFIQDDEPGFWEGLVRHLA